MSERNYYVAVQREDGGYTIIRVVGYRQAQDYAARRRAHGRRAFVTSAHDYETARKVMNA